MINVLREFFFPKKLLGLNSRNLHYILSLNSSKNLKTTKNKLKVKQKLSISGLPTPETYFTISTIKDLNNFDFDRLPNSFVLKPNLGYGGKGIIIVYAKNLQRGYYVAAGRIKVTATDLKFHIFKILEGAYSENKQDVAFFEERVRLDPIFRPFTYKGGIPDIRVITYNYIPIMAMARIPTAFSGGKANLALGAVGLGIDMKTGITTFGIIYNKFIDYFPGTRLLVKNIKIPHFTKILRLAYQASKIMDLNYTGIDIALDREKGPIILEVNGWPGLKIQLANRGFLKDRLTRLKDIKKIGEDRAINIAKELFGEQENQETEEYGNKKVINVFEQVEVISSLGKKLKLLAKVDTGAWRTSIDEDLAEKLGLLANSYKIIKIRSSFGIEERKIVPLTIKIKDELIATEVSIAQRSELKYKVIIGRRDIKNFLVSI